MPCVRPAALVSGPEGGLLQVRGLVVFGLVVVLILVGVATSRPSQRGPSTPAAVASATSISSAATAERVATDQLRNLLNLQECLPAAQSPDPAITWCFNINTRAVDPIAHAVSIDLSQDAPALTALDVTDSESACIVINRLFQQQYGSRPGVVNVTVNGVLHAGEHFGGRCQQY
jgi:hypothetical protein